MLKLIIPEVELYDEKLEEFSYIRGQTLTLEHSLVSLAKWESKWEKPFLTKEPMTTDQIIHYIGCMLITQNVNPILIKQVAKFHLKEIYTYMELPMTATTFRRSEARWVQREIITAEIIYYWMTVFNIPIECQKWHLNRLLTLINVCNEKSKPKKKMSSAAILKRNHELNRSRLKALGTKG